MSAYLPWTVDYKVRKGLELTYEVVDRSETARGFASNKAYWVFVEKILECQKKECPYSRRELKDDADRISLGFGSSKVIGKMIDAVKDG